VTFFWQWSGSGTVADRKARIVAHVEGLFADIDHIFRESSDLSFAVAGIKVRSGQRVHPGSALPICFNPNHSPQTPKCWQIHTGTSLMPSTSSMLSRDALSAYGQYLGQGATAPRDSGKDVALIHRLS
jgi:hypothetical protein